MINWLLEYINAYCGILQDFCGMFPVSVMDGAYYLLMFSLVLLPAGFAGYAVLYLFPKTRNGYLCRLCSGLAKSVIYQMICVLLCVLLVNCSDVYKPYGVYAAGAVVVGWFALVMCNFADPFMFDEKPEKGPSAPEPSAPAPVEKGTPAQTDMEVPARDNKIPEETESKTEETVKAEQSEQEDVYEDVPEERQKDTDSRAAQGCDDDDLFEGLDLDEYDLLFD